jgi:hypothetical protein
MELVERIGKAQILALGSQRRVLLGTGARQEAVIDFQHEGGEAGIHVEIAMFGGFADPGAVFFLMIEQFVAEESVVFFPGTAAVVGHGLGVAARNLLLG